MKIIRSKSFANGTVYALRTEDDFPVEVTDTFLPFYTKDAIGRHQNAMTDTNFGDRTERWMIGVSCMSGCPVRCKFCFDEDTLIIMDDFSYKKIKDIEIGEMVVSNLLTNASVKNFAQYSSKNTISTDVKNLFKRKYIGEMIQIYTEDGNILKCTPEHPIAIKNSLYRNKFIEAKDIKIGDNITSSKLIIDNTSVFEWSVGWFIGFVYGDGILSKNANKQSYKWTISQSEKSVIDFCYELARKFKIPTTKIWTQTSGNSKINYRFSFGEKGILIFNELIKTYSGSDLYKTGYLAGFWDAEGFSFRNNKSYRVCGTNYDELLVIKEFLEHLGYKASIKLYNSNKSHDNTKDCYIVESSLNCIEFCSKFSPQHSKKIFLRDRNVKTFGSLSKVVKIEICKYDGYVYNIETGTNTYYANNILVHNCATGQLKKWRPLTAEEIVEQVEFVIAQNPEYDFVNAKEHKINYTRMGEPFLNVAAVRKAIRIIDSKYPGTHHYISTIGVKNANYSWIKDNITLQISLHSLDEERRNHLIPYNRKTDINGLGSIRTKSSLKTTLNLTLVDEADFDIENLRRIFDPDKFFIKLSPINPNPMSNKNEMGEGVVEGINIA